jgi:hypothetical protein
MTDATILLDEHVGRVFERVLRERGYHVEQERIGSANGRSMRSSFSGVTITTRC